MFGGCSLLAAVAARHAELGQASASGADASVEIRALRDDVALLRAELTALKQQQPPPPPPQQPQQPQRRQVSIADPCAKVSPVFPGDVVVHSYSGFNRDMVRGTTNWNEYPMAGKVTFFNQNAVSRMFDMSIAENDKADDGFFFMCAFSSGEDFDAHQATCTSTYEVPNRPQGPGFQVVKFFNVAADEAAGGACVAGNVTVTGTYFYAQDVNHSGIYNLHA